MILLVFRQTNLRPEQLTVSSTLSSAFDASSKFTLNIPSLREMEENISAKCNLAVLYSAQAPLFNGYFWPSGTLVCKMKFASIFSTNQDDPNRAFEGCSL